MQKQDPTQTFQTLIDIMARLRDLGGCDWDREQTHASLRPYLVEEAYEVLETIDTWIEQQNPRTEAHLCEELGDLLFQVVFHARIAEERGAFQIADVCRAIADKLQRRHPHVFADPSLPRPNWEQLKQKEKESRGEATSEHSVLAAVPRQLPALLRAQRITEKAAQYGFDWPDAEGPRQKIFEEIAEVEAAQSHEEREKEIGDLLFAVVNYARHLGVRAEDALRGTSERFLSRFFYIETRLKAENKSLAETPLAVLDTLWSEAKTKE